MPGKPVAAVEVGDGSPATGDSAEFFAEAAAEGQDAWIVTLEGDALAEAMQEVVIGPDDRIRITGTTSYPWRAICSLRITAGTIRNGLVPVGLSGHAPSSLPDIAFYSQQRRLGKAH